MSRAFTREETNENAIADLGERPISPHRNLVTPDGLAAMDAEIAAIRAELGDCGDDQTRNAILQRDLRYWIARRESAEVVEGEDGDVVRFGMTVDIEDDDGKAQRWHIVGEDEADPAQGSISHVSPMAQALFGKRVGDLATVNHREWEIVGLK